LTQIESHTFLSRIQKQSTHPSMTFIQENSTQIAQHKMKYI